ncbi:MAG: enoyl-CoA hydratase/isomerase family protein [Acidobacteria bacterium]|nr:enoyl-CoA hydratase/isomerase family protein [Acidobacteriota bacterium]
MPGAFRLESGEDGVATLTFDLPDRKANIFTREALDELDEIVAELGVRNDIRCLVLRSAKPDIFIAGADVEAIAHVTDPVQAESGSRYGHRIFAAWEALPFPTVAAVRGTCLGGGTELSLASSWLVVSDRADLRIGLPEIKLGIVPGWGGCVRMPRRIGLLASLDLILAGKAIPGARAFKAGLADAIFPDAGFDARVLEFARGKAGSARRGKGRSRGLRGALLEGNPLGRAFVVSQARRKTLAQTKGRYPAPLRALEVVSTGISRGAAAGFDAEARAIGELAVSPEAKGLIYLFQQMEASKRDATGGAREPVRRPAVIGAGVMGGGIAHLVADKASLPIRVKDIQTPALATALAHAAQLFDKQVRRRRLKPAERRRKMALLQPTLEDAGVEACDLVIEAVVENLAVKQKVFADLSRRVSDRAILATNTSSLSIDAIGQLAVHRERVVGMHFFNPVDKMPLVEVVAGRHTSPETAAAIAAFARRLGKTPVVVRDGPGFLVNRLLAFYSAEAMWLLDEGFRIEDIDRAMLDWGMPMGPLRLGDEVGLDVSAKVGHILHEAFGDRLAFPEWIDRLPEEGRLGVKSGLGIYRYDGKKQLGPDPAVYARLGVEPRHRDPDLAALAERMVLPMVNEAARCLEEGIVGSPGELDLAMVFGTGFPPFRGGLCRWADAEGLATLVGRLERYAEAVGARFAPSDALRRFAAQGGFAAASLAR